jgi:hypothetical protein
MHANSLTGKEADIRSVKGTPLLGYVLLVRFEDLRLITNHSCSDVVFINWYGDVESKSALLVMCF